MTSGAGEAERINFDVLYLSARAWDIQPSEFWAMTFGEWFAEYEWRQSQQKGGNGNGFAGTLNQSDVDRLTALVAEGT